jgi:hypothetical protein
MQLRLRVTPKTGDVYEVETDMTVIVEWERKYKRRASDLAKGIGMEDLAFMAYQAAHQAGHTVPAVFDDFIKKTRKVDVVDQDDAHPTQGAPTDDN